MTTRDPRSRDPRLPVAADEGRPREVTQSLVSTDGEDAHPPFASGTHRPSDDKTRVESPGARARPPTERPPAKPSVLPAPALDDPDGRIGTQLGNYRVAEMLGKGGMGFVYRAEHVKLGREVALKLLRADYAKRKDAVARFIQEARTVNRVRHRNIVDVPDILELEDGTTCIVMEYLRGERLGAWARHGVELPRALAVLVQICDGLAAAHAVGVVHRDLKPDNVFVVPTSDGAEQVKLLDFGVAKLLNRDEEEIGFQTAAGSVVGTPAYMSPEQAGGMTIDARSDIYSLGAIMYELFCGRPMFKGRSFGEYVRKHLTEQPVPPRQTPNGAAIDERLEAVILRALAKDPDARYQTAGEVRDALLSLLGNIDSFEHVFAQIGPQGLVNPPTLHTLHTGSGPLPAIPSLVDGVPSAPMNIPPTRALSAPSGISWQWLIVGALGIVAATLAVVLIARGSRTEPAPAPPAVAATTPAPGPAPTAVPIVVPVPAPIVQPAPAPVTLSFTSTPPGAAVFLADESTHRCHTPCSIDMVRPAAGEPTQLQFVIRREGYVDEPLGIDLAAPRDKYSVRLTPVATTAAGKTGKPVRRDKTAVHTEEPAPPPPPAQPVAPPSTVKPSSDKPTKIDRSSTLDPFKGMTP